MGRISFPFHVLGVTGLTDPPRAPRKPHSYGDGKFCLVRFDRHFGGVVSLLLRHPASRGPASPEAVGRSLLGGSTGVGVPPPPYADVPVL